MPPLPKRRTSRARQGSRRAHKAISLGSLGRCPECGAPRVSHRVCRNCGMYKGRRVLRTEVQRAD